MQQSHDDIFPITGSHFVKNLWMQQLNMRDASKSEQFVKKKSFPKYKNGENIVEIGTADIFRGGSGASRFTVHMVFV